MNSDLFMPFNKPYVAPKSYKYIKEALNSIHHHGGGPFNKKAARMVSEINRGGEVFLTGSCTQALEMATILLDLQPGDEVIMPSYTFTSAATALVNYGVIPVFVDVEPSHLNIDPLEVQKAITAKTKALSIVNYAGYACDFDALNEIAAKHGLYKIEDNAHGFGTTSQGFNLGKWGDVSTTSFHATKNIQCGEGGALIVNRNDLTERARVIQEKGTNRSKFLQGLVNKYSWVDKGGSFLISEVNAAYLLAQLEQFENIQSKRFEVYSQYLANLDKPELSKFFRILNCEDKNHSYHLFGILDKTNKRPEIIGHLHKRGITASFHYQCLHCSPAAEKFHLNQNSHPISEIASANLIRLPLYPHLTSEQIQIICDALVEFYLENE